MTDRLPEPAARAARPAAPGRMRTCLWLALAYASFAVGLLAIVIPGLPTTEFILLSAYAASKSSPRFASWLETHRVFGPMIHNWRHGRVLQRRTKLYISLSMSVCVVIMAYTVPHAWLVAVLAVCMVLVSGWLWSRPERVESQPKMAPLQGE